MSSNTCPIVPINPPEYSNILSQSDWCRCIERGYGLYGETDDSDVKYQIKFLRFLRRHRLEGLFSLVENNGRSRLAQKLILESADRYALREASQQRLWELFLSWANTNSISIIPIKGIALKNENRIPYYPRFYEDIDFLIEQKNARTVVSFLTSQGFLVSKRATAEHSLLCLRSLKSLNFTNKSAICSVDLHIDALARGFPGSLKFNRFVKEESACTISANSLVVLQAVLIVNNFKNSWNRIDKIIDIDFISNCLTESERDTVRSILKEWGYSRVYDITFSLLNRLHLVTRDSLTLDRENAHNAISKQDMVFVADVFNGWFKPIGVRQSALSRNVRLSSLFDSRLIQVSFLFSKVMFPTPNDIAWMPSLARGMTASVLVRLCRIISIMAKSGLGKLMLI